MSKSKKKKNKKRPQSNNVKPNNKPVNSNKKSADSNKKINQQTNKKPGGKPEKKAVDLFEQKAGQTINEQNVDMAVENIESEKTVVKMQNKKTGLLGKLFDIIGLKTKTDYIVCVIGAVIVLALIVLAILMFLGVFKTDESKAATVNYFGRDESDFAVSVISSSEKEQEEMSDDMGLEYDNAKFDFYCLTEYEYSDSNTLLPLSFANPSYNKYTLVFTLTDGHGEVLYRSLGVKPGFMLTYVNLSRNIPYGENELKLYVTAFDTKEKKDETKYYKVGNSIATVKLKHFAETPVIAS